MSIYVGTGFSQDPDPLTAAKEAAFQSKTLLNRDKIDAAIIFSTVHYDPNVVLPLMERLLNKTKMIGCSTAGIIHSQGISNHGIMVITFSITDGRIGISHTDDIAKRDSKEAGSALAQASLRDYGQIGRHLFLFFTDGNLQTNTFLLKGIQETLGNVFPIVGAGSCDDFHHLDSFQLYQSHVLRQSAVGMLIGGQMSISVASRHGWKPLGKPRMVTQANRNIIKTIDGKPAAFLYQEFFGHDAEHIASTAFDQMNILYPLGFFIQHKKEYLIRNTVSTLPDGGLVCQAEIPEGREVHIMIGNKDSCIQAAKAAAQEAYDGLMGKKAECVLVIESMARLKLLGRLVEKEQEEIKNIFGPDVPIAGMFAKGEICPLPLTDKMKQPFLQNESIIILALA